jgi:urease accessory protein
MKHRITLILLLSAGSAWAHPGHADGGFANGLVHPLLGKDHWLAMLGLGIWSAAARLPRAALATVCTGMAAGALAPLPLPAVEPLLAASVLVAGLMGLGSTRLPASSASAWPLHSASSTATPTDRKWPASRPSPARSPPAWA